VAEPGPDNFLVAWGLFRKLEAAAELPDPEVDAFYEAAEAEIGTGGLLSGWAIVAAVLRKSLREHAEQLGCDCGSDEWLEQQGLHYTAEGNDG
jgi:hypothetical protein